MLRAAEKTIFESSQSVWSVQILKKTNIWPLSLERRLTISWSPRKTLIHSALVPDSGAHNTFKQHLGLQGVSCLSDIEDCVSGILKYLFLCESASSFRLLTSVFFNIFCIKPMLSLNCICTVGNNVHFFSSRHFECHTMPQNIWKENLPNVHFRLSFIELCITGKLFVTCFHMQYTSSLNLPRDFPLLCFSFVRLTRVNSCGAVTPTTPTSAKPRRGRLSMGPSVLLEK